MATIRNAFAMVGSANHNERSMWHDSEDMLVVRWVTKNDFPARLRSELINIALSGYGPEGEFADDPFAIFRCFTIQMTLNSAAFKSKKEAPSLVFPYIPPRRPGSVLIS